MLVMSTFSFFNYFQEINFMQGTGKQKNIDKHLFERNFKC